VAGCGERCDAQDQPDLAAPPDTATLAPAANREEVLARIRSVRAELDRLGVRSVKLFGSAARDEMGPESDIDVLVEFREPPSLRPYIGTLEVLERAVGRRVDMATPGAISPLLAKYIAADLIDAA
jgi:predicted nucleotidyltransferase